MCGAAPVFENATIWPTLAVIVAGSNSKSLIETATAPASFVSLHVPAAADVAADGAEAAAEAAGEDPLDEQAASTSARPAMRVPSERRRHPILLLSRTSPYAGRRRPVSAAIVCAMIDPPTMRRLLLHEARVHAIPNRDLRDLGDAILLHDPVETEPFWNRLEGIHWPAEPDAFDRRLTEILVLFASIGRRPHIWASPAHDAPTDLVARLAANGFRDMGPGCVMALVDPVPVGATRRRRHRRRA